MIEALFFIIAAQGHVFDNFDDAGLCQVISRNMTQVPPPTPPVESTQMNADCGAKRIHAQISLGLSGADFDGYVQMFMATARAGVCDMSNPTMVAFADRGWGFTYTFEASDGTSEEIVLDC